jgi:hypothetical protein
MAKMGNLSQGNKYTKVLSRDIKSTNSKPPQFNFQMRESVVVPSELIGGFVPPNENNEKSIVATPAMSLLIIEPHSHLSVNQKK